MTNPPTIFFQQDSLIKPPPRQDRLILNLPVEKPKIDLERTLEVIGQSEQREQEIIASQRRVYVPREEPLRLPSIEVDTLMARYGHIGCTPRIDFPDTLSLTALERYYQPMARATATASADTTTIGASYAIADTTGLVWSPDSMLIDTSAAKTGVATTVSPEPVVGLAGEIRPAGYPSVITLFLMCGLALLAGIKFHFGQNLAQAFMSYFSYRQAQRMYEERKESDRQAALLSNILFTFITGIYITVILPFFGAVPLWGNYALSVIIFSLVVGTLYSIKAGVWRLMGVVFMTGSFSKVYIYNMYLYNRNTGLFIFPLVAVIPYITGSITPYIVYSVVAVFILSYLLKVRRIFQIILAQNVSVFYFILYLCTLEILPLLVFIKSCKVLKDCLIM